MEHKKQGRVIFEDEAGLYVNVEDFTPVVVKPFVPFDDSEKLVIKKKISKKKINKDPMKEPFRISTDMKKEILDWATKKETVDIVKAEPDEIIEHTEILTIKGDEEKDG